jgi:hypothetical protein
VFSGRWLVLIVVGTVIHWLARVGPLGPGANLDDGLPSTVDLVLSGVAVTLFVLASVVWRGRQEIPAPLAMIEAVVWGMAAFWPAVSENLTQWMGDERPFAYQYLFAIALAGSMLGVVSSRRRRNLDLPR